MDLYSERGFDNTTVAEIAERAGLTERTFFRHFEDKREVLFGGAGALQQLLVSQVVNAPRAQTPLEAILTALLEAATVVFEERRGFSRRRQAIIAASGELQEREQVKLASLALALADALQRRGVADLPAGLAAEAGIAIFKIAFERWIGDAGERTLSHWIRECADALEALTTGREAARSR
jgi:AcrR family transcriptional regulator